jgi:hypothetical protein
MRFYLVFLLIATITISTFVPIDSFEEKIEATKVEIDVSTDGDSKPIDLSEKTVVKKGPQSRFVKNIKVESIDKAWEEGDSSDELENEYEIQRKVAAKVQKNKGFNMERPQDIAKMMKKDPLAFSASSSGGGATMYFVELKDANQGGKKWTKKMVDDVATRWGGLMKSGNLPATVFNIGDSKNEDKGEGRLLVNVEKGWLSVDSMKFILSQPETAKLTKDNKDYTAKDLGISDDDDEDDDDD